MLVLLSALLQTGIHPKGAFAHIFFSVTGRLDRCYLYTSRAHWTESSERRVSGLVFQSAMFCRPGTLLIMTCFQVEGVASPFCLHTDGTSAVGTKLYVNLLPASCEQGLSVLRLTGRCRDRDLLNFAG